MSKTEELLAVLDMPERKQNLWMFTHGIFQHHPTDENRIESLADLAFRLRDEAEQKNSILFGVALVDVQQKVAPDFHENHYAALNVVEWFIRFAQPIHWIIAALIAKQKEKPDGK